MWDREGRPLLSARHTPRGALQRAPSPPRLPSCPVICLGPDGRPVSIEKVDLCLMSYEQLRDELGGASEPEPLAAAEVCCLGTLVPRTMADVSEQLRDELGGRK